MNKLIISILTAFILSCTVAIALEIEQKDYLSLIVGNYVHGFKELETSVTTSNNSVSLGIYYDISRKNKKRANQLAKRFRFQVPEILKSYKWAKNVKVAVNIYSENRSGRGH